MVEERVAVLRVLFLCGGRRRKARLERLQARLAIVAAQIDVAAHAAESEAARRRRWRGWRRRWDLQHQQLDVGQLLSNWRRMRACGIDKLLTRLPRAGWRRIELSQVGEDHVVALNPEI